MPLSLADFETVQASLDKYSKHRKFNSNSYEFTIAPWLKDDGESNPALLSLRSKVISYLQANPFVQFFSWLFNLNGILRQVELYNYYECQKMLNFIHRSAHGAWTNSVLLSGVNNFLTFERPKDTPLETSHPGWTIKNLSSGSELGKIAQSLVNLVKQLKTQAITMPAVASEAAKLRAATFEQGSREAAALRMDVLIDRIKGKLKAEEHKADDKIHNFDFDGELDELSTLLNHGNSKH